MHGKTVQTPFVTGLSNKKLAAVLQSAASSNPTPCEYRLSFKNEFNKIIHTYTQTNTNTIDECKEIIMRAVSTVVKQELQTFLNIMFIGYQTCLRFEGGQIQHLA